jgi:hypothetical protein
VRLTGYTKWISVSYSYEVVTSVEPVARRKATPPMRNDKAAVAAPPNQPSAPSVNELIAQGIAIEGNDSRPQEMGAAQLDGPVPVLLAGNDGQAPGGDGPAISPGAQCRPVQP